MVCFTAAVADEANPRLSLRDFYEAGTFAFHSMQLMVDIVMDKDHSVEVTVSLLCKVIPLLCTKLPDDDAIVTSLVGRQRKIIVLYQ